jgi:alkylation response protein AidB-like acyl-CoA dehydrogenase
MDLALDEQQVALVNSLADLLSKHAPIDRVRAAEPDGFDLNLWQELSGIGIVEMAVSESAGGWGAGLLDLVLIAEQVGATAAPAPVVEAQVSSRLLAALSSAAGRSLLDEAIAGSRIVTIALHPAVRGSARLVPAGALAHTALVLQGDRLGAVALTPTSVRVIANLANAPLADIQIETPVTELQGGPSAISAFERAIDEWLTLTAGLLVGLSATAQRITCEYARERRAWDTPIGAFQGVAHPLTDGAVNVDGARLLVRKAAWELDRGGPRGRELAAMAFAFASETARDVTYNAVHFHGGYGFTLESDPQLFYRRARGWARVWGEPEDAYRRASISRYHKTES